MLVYRVLCDVGRAASRDFRERLPSCRGGHPPRDGARTISRVVVDAQSTFVNVANVGQMLLPTIRWQSLILRDHRPQARIRGRLGKMLGAWARSMYLLLTTDLDNATRNVFSGTSSSMEQGSQRARR